MFFGLQKPLGLMCTTNHFLGYELEEVSGALPAGS